MSINEGAATLPAAKVGIGVKVGGTAVDGIAVGAGDVVLVVVRGVVGFVHSNKAREACLLCLVIDLVTIKSTKNI